MNALDSHLEALALDYLSFGLLTIVNNIWTWVAVITAAVSFWRIKSSSSSTSTAAVSLDQTRVKIPGGSSTVKLVSYPVERVATEPAELPEPASPSLCKTTTSFGAWEREGSTKGKFTLYFENDGNDDHDGDWKGGENSNGDGDVGGNGNGGVVGEGWWDRWEKALKMKTGVEEWYSYQDLTVINGSVVRLWDDCRRRNATPLELVGGVAW